MRFVFRKNPLKIFFKKKKEHDTEYYNRKGEHDFDDFKAI